MSDKMREALQMLRDHCQRADLFADAVKQADEALAEQPKAEQAAEKGSHGHDWVACPICGESDMRRDLTELESGLVHCTNLNCASNGGANRTAMTLPEPIIPRGMALVPKRMNAEMKRIVESDEWEWADLLAAAGAITESEHEHILNNDGHVAAPSVANGEVSYHVAVLRELSATLIHRSVERHEALEWALARLASPPAPSVPDAEIVGQAVSDHFKALDCGDGSFSFDPCSSHDIDALVSAIIAAQVEPMLAALAFDSKREMSAFSNWAWLKEGEPIGRMDGQAAGIAAWMARAKLSGLPASSVPDDVAKDAARFRWLTENHAGAETRAVVRMLCKSIPTRSLSGMRLDIDAAMLAAAPDAKHSDQFDEKARSPGPTLHAAIMNLTCNPEAVTTMPECPTLAYKFGHRDARHAAAELASASESTP